MLFVTTITTKEQKIAEEVVNTVESSADSYISSIAGNLYKQSIEDIANTQVGNKVVRRRNLQQIMKQSFFYGANRFGNNFIA